MELRITTQMEPGVLPEIQWNHEELKAEIAAKAAEYKAIAYTEDQAADMKKDRATLNKLVTAFEDQRKQVKKFYHAPYEKFEAQVKEVLLPVREAIGVIDEGLAEIDRQYRVEKTNRMREYYEAYVDDLRAILPFEKTVNESDYRKSVKDKNLEQKYLDLFKRTKEDLDALEELPERFRDKALMKYADTLSLTEALREGKRLEELERAMEERRRKQEEEKSLREEDSSRRANQAKEVTAKEQPTSEDLHQGQEAPQVMQLDFRVWGTGEQLMGLRQYLIDNQIKFGKVE